MALESVRNKRAVSAHRLSMRVVDAAQQWAAEVLASPDGLLDQGTAEGRARIALLDAVHDLEYHQASSMGTGRHLGLFSDEPGGR